MSSLIIVKSTINNRTLQQIAVINRRCRSSVDTKLDRPPLRKKLRIQELHLTELALK